MGMPNQVALVAACVFIFGSSAARAESPAEFYKGRTITVIVSTSAGGDYDTRARLVARFMGRHIPGQPTFVVQNMPGAGGLRGANWLANVAPKDGSAIAAVQQHIPLSHVLGRPGVEYDASKFNFIGNTSSSPIVVMAWSKSEIKSFFDVLKQEFVVGGTGAGSASVQLPLMLNAVLGTRFKVVPGYPGGSEIYLAMERGEVAGRVTQSWAGWKAQKGDWLRDGKITPLAQGGRKRLADLPKVPLIIEFAQNNEARQLIQLMLSSDEIARPLIAPHGVPKDRVDALRSAFMRAISSPDFQSEAKKANLDVDPMSGTDAQSIIEALYETPRAIVEQAKRFAGGGG